MIGHYMVSLVMPCRNEAEHLESLIADVPDFYDEILLVSNCSTDDTVNVGKKIMKSVPRFRLIVDNRSAGGIGYGYAHMTGISAATGDIIVCADSDGTYPIDDASKILREMSRRHLSFASCTRYPDASIPHALQLGVRALNCEIFLLYGFHLHDSLSGMWVFKRSVVPQLHLTEGDWNLSPQIKLNAHKYLGSRFGEVKVSQKIRLGETKQSYLKTGFHHLFWILKNRFSEPRQIQTPDSNN